MAGIPYLPPGQSDLPAERFILFADTANFVNRIDETASAKRGVAFTGEWQSGTLNQMKEGHEFTLSLLELFYAGTATTITISASGDGGETLSTPQGINLVTTTLTIPRVAVSFDDGGATGIDVRFRIQLDTTILVNIFGYRPHLVDRGDLILP